MREQVRKQGPFGSLVPLKWSVSAGGYRWVTVGGERFLVPIRTRGTDRRYNPLEEEHSLFLTFAALEQTEESFLAFANAYGHLGALTRDKDAGGIVAVDGEQLPGERIEFWKESVFWMRQAVRLWEALRPEAGPDGIRRLEEWFRLEEWRDPDADLTRLVYLPDGEPPCGGGSWFSSRDLLQHHRRRTHWPTTAAQQGVFVLSSIVNTGLIDTRARLWETTRVRALGVPLVLGSEPYNLVGALWLQFALAIEGNLRYKPCERCGRWFHVPPKAKLAGSKFCRDSCRVLTYRDRKAKVQKLAAEGVKPEEIAKSEKVELRSVKKWIRESASGKAGKRRVSR